MVIYKLGIFNNNVAKEIDISNIINIKAKDSLKNIDRFTEEFNDEYELKYYLIDKGIISLKDLDSEINVIYKNNGYIKKLPIAYLKHKILFSDIMLKEKIKSLSKNLEFLDKLCAYYSRNIHLDSIISDIRLYIEDVRVNGQKNAYNNEELLNTALNDLIIKVTKLKDLKTGIYKSNYRGHRDLLMFIYWYDGFVKNKNRVENIFDNTNNVYTDEAYEIAKMNSKWILSSEGDPDFPPNSEEEKMYKELQEKLLELPIKNPNFDDEDEYRKFK